MGKDLGTLNPILISPFLVPQLDQPPFQSRGCWNPSRRVRRGGGGGSVWVCTQARRARPARAGAARPRGHGASPRARSLASAWGRRVVVAVGDNSNIGGGRGRVVAAVAGQRQQQYWRRKRPWVRGAVRCSSSSRPVAATVG